MANEGWKERNDNKKDKFIDLDNKPSPPAKMRKKSLIRRGGKKRR